MNDCVDSSFTPLWPKVIGLSCGNNLSGNQGKGCVHKPLLRARCAGGLVQ